MIKDTIPPPLSKPSNKSRQGLFVTPEMREKRSKRKSEDEGKRKRVCPEGSPPAAVEDALALVPLVIIAPLEGA